ncbi:hydrolase [Nitrogeniibacter mangrovi]|uniref:Hydrolase n=1 Tax=Nitrogeniibacter mangrovi TaxID=2016596 RepID=A0A6C1B4T3_9RHOO|nr:hydrolase [Nitrogeniibacter mangrovi]QID17875.1 hydrolase [Nitrogeniibacter mangrovi]
MNATGSLDLIDRHRSTLLLIDLQERLYPAIDEGASVLDNDLALVRCAAQLGVPCVISEQYPQGLGPSVAALREAAPDARVVHKTHFSCVAEGCLTQTAVDARPQVVVGGTEAHVCVLQTVLDLLAIGKTVFVVADGIGSRTPQNKALAIERMRSAGARIVSREMVLFEWLREAASDEFRRINREFIR